MTCDFRLGEREEGEDGEKSDKTDADADKNKCFSS